MANIFSHTSKRCFPVNLLWDHHFQIYIRSYHYINNKLLQELVFKVLKYLIQEILAIIWIQWSLKFNVIPIILSRNHKLRHNLKAKYHQKFLIYHLFIQRVIKASLFQCYKLNLTMVYHKQFRLTCLQPKYLSLI